MSGRRFDEFYLDFEKPVRLWKFLVAVASSNIYCRVYCMLLKEMRRMKIGAFRGIRRERIWRNMNKVEFFSPFRQNNFLEI